MTIGVTGRLCVPLTQSSTTQQGCLSCSPIVDPRHMLESIFLSIYCPPNLLHADLPPGLCHGSIRTRVCS